MSMESSVETPSGMVGHAADRLCDSILTKAAPVCVGLDPVVDRLPAGLSPQSDSLEDAASAIESFSIGILDAIMPHVGVVKFQSACFERYGPSGVAALHRCLMAARDRNLVTILDSKRGDIGISASHYAAASGQMGGDWTTINGWLGEDGITPFIEDGAGAFVLVRTSNPSGETIQNQPLKDGRTVAQAMAELVSGLSEPTVGSRGYGLLGAVVGATHPAELESFRSWLPHSILLMPGYGAQGGTAEGLKPCFDSTGLGGLVTASRSVIYAFGSETDWTSSVGQAAALLADEVGKVAGLRS
ncbi:MAG: orotidine-5'-phosphate decarboxylase [Phycisphaerales bacterium]|nr:orotidine-5'-phosphate decarboxylase [Phycisphaerales bacterium]